MGKSRNTIDKKAFEQLYLTHHKRVWAFVLRHVKDPKKAEDLVQDTFLKVWEKRQTIDFQEKFVTLLFVIARNLVINAYHRDILEKEKLKEIQVIMDVGSDKGLADERLHALRKAIDTLPDRRQQIFKMSHQQGLTHQEIADELSISKKTVEDHMTKARHFLREKLTHLLSNFLTFF